MLCQRCLRTICPQCQVQAAVGVHCVECAKAGQLPRSRRVRTGVWARLTASGGPTVTYALIGITLVVFILQLIPGLGVTEALLYSPLYSIPNDYYGLEPWRTVSAVFVHSTGFIFHVLLNMYTLWIFGQAMERMIGHGRFLSLYLISGLGGSVAVLALSPVNSSVVGASGAIFGLMGAFVVIHRRLGNNMTQMFVLLAINFAIGFIPGMTISWQAHLGGLVTGAVLGLIFAGTRKRSQFVLQVALVIAFAAVLVTASLWPIITGQSL